MHAQGRQAALRAFGLEKLAGVMDTARALGSGFRNIMVGGPGTFDALKHQARTGTLTKPGGMYHDALGWLAPKMDFGQRGERFTSRAKKGAGSLASFALGPGMMAYSGYQALKAPPEQRGEATGRLLGGLVGGTVAGPFGAIGQAVGGSIGDAAGAAAGRMYDARQAPAASPFDAPAPPMS